MTNTNVLESQLSLDAKDQFSDELAYSELDRPERLITESGLTLELVAGVAGDRVLTSEDQLKEQILREKAGKDFYADMLYVVTHQSFSAEYAQTLWDAILKHKCDMSYRLDRNVRIAVATLDYLSNLTGAFPLATVISESQYAEMIRLSLKDGLTRLFNHAYCFQSIQRELRRYSRYKAPVSIMMIDIDNFKRINDTYGHPEGDKVLIGLAEIIAGSARDTDICCRYGGEEFTVILPSTPLGDAVILAERLRQRVIEFCPGNHSITISIGLACSHERNSTAQLLVAEADKALYRAKNSGRNRICLVTDFDSQSKENTKNSVFRPIGEVMRWFVQWSLTIRN